jgi:hypothetical protein
MPHPDADPDTAYSDADPDVHLSYADPHADADMYLHADADADEPGPV